MPPTPSTPSNPELDPLSLVRRLGQGEFVDELAAAIHTVSAAVRSTGQKGRVTVTLEIVKARSDETDLMVNINETVSMAPPKRKAKGAFAFVNEDGLYRKDPREEEFDLGKLRKVESGEVRRDAASGEVTTRRVVD